MEYSGRCYPETRREEKRRGEMEKKEKKVLMKERAKEGCFQLKKQCRRD
jgi:hypothetical protein